MTQKTFQQNFIVKPRPVFKISLFFSDSDQSYTEAHLECTTNFEYRQQPKYSTIQKIYS